MARGAQVKPGDSVAVFGVGGSGLAAIAAAKALGAGVIIAVGSGADALARATAAGATATIDLSAPDIPARVRSLSPSGVQCLVDCPDEHGGAFAPSSELLAPDGRTFRIATPVDGAGGGMYAAAPEGDPEADIGLVMTWMSEGCFDPAKLVRKRYTIEQINEAVGDLEGDPGGQIVLVVEPLR